MVFLNPGGYVPMRTKFIPKIDSVPYAVHDTLFVDSLVEVEVEVPVPYEVEKRVEVQVTQSVDTMEILKIFYTKNIQKNVLNLPNGVGTIT